MLRSLVGSEMCIRDSLEITCEDCMALMARYPDKHFDLAIVDPPYGIGVNSMNMGSRKTVRPDKKNWDDEIPTPEYFAELRRVSKKQIVWGGNYFPLPPSRGWCAVSYTHLRAHETPEHIVCRLLLDTKKPYSTHV